MAGEAGCRDIIPVTHTAVSLPRPQLGSHPWCTLHTLSSRAPLPPDGHRHWGTLLAPKASGHRGCNPEAALQIEVLTLDAQVGPKEVKSVGGMAP